jgi:hypothetical protein
MIDLDTLRDEVKLIRSIQITIESNHVDKNQIVLQTSQSGHSNWWEKEEVYTTPLYKETPYLNSLMKKYNMLRSRILDLPSKSCYTLHSDRFDRVHIPIHTNDSNLFVIDSNVYRLPVGDVYLSQTTLPHTYLNGSKETRTHIVGAVLYKAYEPITVME